MRWIAALAGMVSAALAASGCATASIEDAVPPGALAQMPEGGTPPAQRTPQDAAAVSGTYPDLNAAPAAAAPQITAGEKASETAHLRARRDELARQEPQRDVSDEADALRRLAGSHGDAVLRQIEGE